MIKKSSWGLGVVLCAVMLLFSGCSLGSGSEEKQIGESFTASGGLSEASVDKILTSVKLTKSDLRGYGNEINWTAVDGKMTGEGEVFFQLKDGKAKSPFTYVNFTFSASEVSEDYGGLVEISIVDKSAAGEIDYSSSITQSWRATKIGNTITGEIYNSEDGEIFVTFGAGVQ